MSDLPRLSREFFASEPFPEKIVQFGTGAFLRGFFDFFVDEANRRGEFSGCIVAVSSTGSSRDAQLNAQDGLFTLAIQGIEEGRATQRSQLVSSVTRAISAGEEWGSVLALARDPELRLVVSNTTEVGIVLDEEDRFDADPPRSFPGKLTRFLYERASHFGFDVTRGLIVLPCELIEDNGTALRGIVLELAHRWRLDPKFEGWLESAVTFCNTLVDRIVPGPPSRDDAARLEASLGYRDALLTMCETYALFAIEGDEALRSRLGFANDPRIVVAPDIRPYRERKVRVLNGGHTISVPIALLAGLETVREAVEDERVGRFMRRAILDEIVPSLDAADADTFARDVLARFANPYIRHALIDITLHQTTKLRVRVVPSIVGYHQRTGRVPGALAFGFAGYLAFMRGEVLAERRAAGLPVREDSEGDRVRAAWAGTDISSDASLEAFVARLGADVTLWGTDLAALDGFIPLVADNLGRILRHGMSAALDHHLTETASTSR
jgi:tagaturonate reductase